MKTLKKMTVRALACLAGWPRGKTYGFANEAAATSLSADTWKRKTAMAIGKPELANASDDDLMKAHDAHMVALQNEMDDDDSSDLPNEQKTEMGTLLANALSEGRILAADKAGWETKFANDFDGTKTELAKVVKPTVVPAPNEKEVKLRNELVMLHLDNAVTSGRIKAADRPGWQTKFANDYDGTKTAIETLKPTIKTDPKTKGLRQREVVSLQNETERRAKVGGLVNEKMTKVYGKFRQDKYDEIFNLVRSENPDLFPEEQATK